MEILDMKIRNGFVTNSSSTNFIIISNQEITREFLNKQLNPFNDKRFKNEIEILCEAILYKKNLINDADIDSLQKEYGGKIKKIYNKMKKKKCFIYVGELTTEESSFEAYMACSPFEYKTKELYINGMNSTI